MKAVIGILGERAIAIKANFFCFSGNSWLGLLCHRLLLALRTCHVLYTVSLHFASTLEDFDTSLDCSLRRMSLGLPLTFQTNRIALVDL